MEALKQDKIPWKRGWRTSQPYNAVSGNNYHGVNNLLLSFIAHEKGYLDPRWCTFKQAADNNWHINKGEKGTPIEFWSLYDSETKKKLTPAEADKLKNELSREDYQKRVHPLSETYTVFNAEQISGIPELAVENNLVDVKNLIEKRDVLIKNMGVNFLEQGQKAYYLEDRDLLSLPPVQAFNSDYEYFSTLLHEAAHATGHENRLKRDLSGIKGSASYAKEELRAEIASAFVSQDIGFEQTEANIDNHKAYLQSWIDVLQNNPEELFAAIRDAEKISDYLIEKGEFEILEVNPTYDYEKMNTMGKINDFAKEHNVPIYTDIPEGFHINEGALTAPSGTRWIQDNGSIIHNTVKRGLLLDKDLNSLYKAYSDFNSYQINQIRKGLEHGLDVSVYAKPMFSGAQMDIIRMGLIKKLDVSIYAKPEFEWEQMNEIRKGLEKGLDVSIYAKPEFEWGQMNCILQGLESGLDISVYAKPEFEWEQMNCILLGLENDLDVSVYAKPEFEWEQMNEIRKGLEHGLDVSVYAKSEFDWKQMVQIRKELELQEKLENKTDNALTPHKGEYIKINPDTSEHPNSALNFSQDEKHGLSQKNQNKSKSQRDNPILKTNNNAIKNIAADFLHQQQQGKRDLIEQ